MDKAQTPRAYINVKDLGFAVLENEESGNIEYGEPIQTRGVQTIGLPASGDTVVAWADGSPIESVVSDGDPTLTLGMHQLPPEVEEMIFNTTFDDKGISVEEWGHQPNPVAVWFKRERKDGSYRWHGFKKVLFSQPEEEQAAREGTVEFGQLSIEGRVMKIVGSEAKHIKADSSKTEDFSDSDFFQTLLAQSVDSEDPEGPEGA